MWVILVWNYEYLTHIRIGPFLGPDPARESDFFPRSDDTSIDIMTKSAEQLDYGRGP